MKLKPEIEFVLRACPNQWAEYASELREALDDLTAFKDQGLIVSQDAIDEIIVKKSPVSRTWLLLAGFALENLLKGLLIAENPEYISNGQLSSKVHHHKLTELAKSLTTISFKKQEIQTIELLQQLSPSWGRDPVPKRIADIKQEVVLSNKIEKYFHLIFEKLDRHLYNLIKKGWSGPHHVRLAASFRSEYENLPRGYEKMTMEELFRWRSGRKRCDKI